MKVAYMRTKCVECLICTGQWSVGTLELALQCARGFIGQLRPEQAPAAILYNSVYFSAGQQSSSAAAHHGMRIGCSN